MRDAGKNKRTKRQPTAGRPRTAEGKRLKQLLDELHGREQQESAHRAEAILKLIRSRQDKRLPTLEDTLSEAQHKRLKPLAWLIQDQSYTAQEIMTVATINEQRLRHLEAGDREFSRQRANTTNNKTTKRRKT